MDKEEPSFANLLERLARLDRRVDFLEDRLLSYYKNRWDVVDKVADYLVGAELPGDYCEFGVFEGKTFSYAAVLFARLFPTMRFVAFDSFEGLPALSADDAKDGYSSGFHRGQFLCGADQFRANLRERGVSMERVIEVAGWFNDTLKPGHPVSERVGPVAAAWIDCDLYSSTVPILDFLTHRLSVGTVLLFDDWRCFRNQKNYGQQRACREWLAREPQITLNEFVDFGFHGVSFTVASC